MTSCVLGVDGFARGWVGVLWAGPGSVPEVLHRVDFGALVDAAESRSREALAAIGVDMPVGLPERGVRASDAAVRAVLGPRRSSLFATPVRAAVATDDWAEASAAQRALGGSGLSKQSHALRHGIRQVEGWIRATGRIAYEVHPELSFAVLAGGAAAPAPMTAAKTTWDGDRMRRDLLHAIGLLPGPDIGAAGAAVPPMDVLDASVVAWSAWRIALGDAQAWPSGAAAAEPAIWS